VGRGSVCSAEASPEMNPCLSVQLKLCPFFPFFLNESCIRGTAGTESNFRVQRPIQDDVWMPIHPKNRTLPQT
jgi:hypothetical protein